MWGFAPLLGHLWCLIKSHWVLDCWLDKISNLKTSVWALGNFDQHFLHVLIILLINRLQNQSLVPVLIIRYAWCPCRRKITITWQESLPPDWARVKMGSFFAISTRICFWASGLSSISYLCLSEYDSWNYNNKHCGQHHICFILENLLCGRIINQ